MVKRRRRGASFASRGGGRRRLGLQSCVWQRGGGEVARQNIETRERRRNGGCGWSQWNSSGGGGVAAGTSMRKESASERRNRGLSAVVTVALGVGAGGSSSAGGMRGEKQGAATGRTLTCSWRSRRGRRGRRSGGRTCRGTARTTGRSQACRLATVGGDGDEDCHVARIEGSGRSGG